MALCWYISAHGLGHAVRSVAILNALPADIPVIVRSAVAEKMLRQEIRRPITFEPARFDCGALQGSDFRVDADSTLRTYAEVHRRNGEVLDSEVSFLRSHGVRLVVGDVPSFAFRVARAAGLPGIAIANFTWADIYAPHVAERPEYAALLAAIRDEYGMATLCLRLGASLEMPVFARQRDIGFTCRPVAPIRSELADAYGLDPARRWVQIYVGQWETGFDWDRLARVPNAEFLCLGQAPAGVTTVKGVDARRFPGQDVAAACDVVLAKAGYGIVADCIGGDTPLIYTTRDDFAEFPALDRDLRDWGRAICLDEATFLAGDLAPWIDQAPRLPLKRRFATDGVRVAAEILADAWRDGAKRHR